MVALFPQKLIRGINLNNNFLYLKRSFAYQLLRATRPRQWIKNFALFTALILSGQLDIVRSVWLALGAFAIFCAASSATYLLNDVFDIERDRLHPFKKKRPFPPVIFPFNLPFF